MVVLDNGAGASWSGLRAGGMRETSGVETGGDVEVPRLYDGPV
jgi:hypothetical protein